MKGGFFNAASVGGIYDRVYKAEDWAKFFNNLISNGVFVGNDGDASDKLKVVTNGGMSVKVLHGFCYIKGYYGEADEDGEVFAIPIASGVYARIDIIVARLDLISRTLTLELVSGEPATVPVAPVPQRTESVYEVVLAQVNIPAGAVSIEEINITDTRADSELCGWVKNIVSSGNTFEMEWEDEDTGEIKHKVIDSRGFKAVLEEPVKADLQEGRIDFTYEVIEE